MKTQTTVNQSAGADQKPQEELNGQEEQDVSSRLQALEKQLEEEKRARLSLEDKNKDLSVRLTKEQQVRAEFERFHTATLPKLNQAIKSFDEQWTEAPEMAVENKIQAKVAPLDIEMAKTRAQNWFTQIMIKNPAYSKYESRVIELGEIYPANTHSRDGIEGLFRMARAEDLEKENESLKTTRQAEKEKDRTFTESSEARNTNINTPRPRLDAAQQEVADKLGIKHDDYLKYVGKVRSA
jgi:hypothetical protein